MTHSRIEDEPDHVSAFAHADALQGHLCEAPPFARGDQQSTAPLPIHQYADCFSFLFGGESERYVDRSVVEQLDIVLKPFPSAREADGAATARHGGGLNVHSGVHFARTGGISVGFHLFLEGPHKVFRLNERWQLNSVGQTRADGAATDSARRIVENQRWRPLIMTAGVHATKESEGTRRKKRHEFHHD
jgi:hypothetical protein